MGRKNKPQLKGFTVALNSFLTLLLMKTTLGMTEAIPKYYMHQSCSEKIRSTDPGGIIILDSTLFPAAQQVNCSVVIQQITYGLHYPSGILFRFSEIGIDGPCQNNNITITDGSNHYNNQGVQGLKNPICGRNSSLMKDLTFVTQSDSLTIMYRRNQGENNKARFNMTFMSYFEGPCADVPGYFLCDNKRCISQKFMCLDSSPCRDVPDCIPKENLTLPWEHIVEYDELICILLVIFYIGLLSFLFACLRKFWIKRKALSDLPFREQFIHICLCSYCRKTESQVHRCTSSRTPGRHYGCNMEQRALSEHSQESPYNTTRINCCCFTQNYPHNGNTRTVCLAERSTDNLSLGPPFYYELMQMTPSTDPETSSLPSYSEVIANMDKYTKQQPLDISPSPTV